jgi:uncharacterized membrane protein
VSKSRLESFSDGVLAVAITLLVLNIEVPPVPAGSSLARELGHQWPAYVAYLTSFMTIGIIWINHHAMINRLREPDHVILILNLLLLLSIGVLPFATNLMAKYLTHSSGQHLAAGIYSGAFLLMAVLFASLNWHILFRKTHLLGVELSEGRRRWILSRGIVGVAPYTIATALAPVSAYVTFGICIGVAVFYALPIANGAGQ